MIYHFLQSIIGQFVRAFNADVHGMFQCVFTHPAIRSFVFIRFVLLNVRSTVAVVTGNTSKIAASFDKFGNATEISPLPINLESTCCKELLLYCMKMTHRNSFHSDSVSSASMSGFDTPSSSFSFTLCATL